MMKHNAIKIAAGLVVGWCSLCSDSVWSLAIVESRREKPVVRASSNYSPSPSVDSAPHILLKQNEALKQELNELRGLIETQQHEIEQLKKSQQDFYKELDKRLVQLSKNTPAKSQSMVSVKPIPIEKSSASAIAMVPVEHNTVAPVVATEKDAYEAAYNLVRTKQYVEATKAFQDYLNRFPTGERTPGAYFWLGEIYMVQWQAEPEQQALLDKAAEAFLNVTSKFPNHQKVPDALLKLGLVQHEKGNFAAAQQYFTEVKERYPGSAAARIAQMRLKSLD